MSEAFHLLDSRVQKWIWAQQWSELRDIQEQSIRVLLEGRGDLVIAAGTASGKTEAAFLPICSWLVTRAASTIQALYVGPLKALINDQFLRLDSLCEELGVPVHRWHGDVSSSAKKATLSAPSGILLITPESLEALFVNRGGEIRRLFGELEFVVVDELHAFLGTERGRQLKSLLRRIDCAIGRLPRRVGLSATLGDIRLAAEALRPRAGHDVTVLESRNGGGELRMKLLGYVDRPGKDTDKDEEVGAAEIDIGNALFRTLRGGRHLVFANSRGLVEYYADTLCRACERERLPCEFFAHHGSLSKEIREDAERRLKDDAAPCTVVATSTLELGIDIGRVVSVAQVGPPPSVASVRQRLGRSGRRGDPAILRVYVGEPWLDERTRPTDRIRPRLMQTVAMLELMLERWVEPPPERALHLSTMVQQLLSMTAERGGVRAEWAYEVLCASGPFRGVDPAVFKEFLRALGRSKAIEQDPRGALMPGAVGERILHHYSFFAAFQTPEEYRVVNRGKTLGTLDVAAGVAPDTYLVFAGRRWHVDDVLPEEKIVLVSPAGAARIPRFAGGCAEIHQVVRTRMRELYGDAREPGYLDRCAVDLIRQGRSEFLRMGLLEGSIVEDGRDAILFPWLGDRQLFTLWLIMTEHIKHVHVEGVAIVAEDTTTDELNAALATIAGRPTPDPIALADRIPCLALEKHDWLLSRELLARNFAVRRLDVLGAQEWAIKLRCRGSADANG